MFTHEFTRAGSTTRVTIFREAAGWELRQESDSGEIQHAHYGDWHRVERALRSIGLGFPLRAQEPKSAEHA